MVANNNAIVVAEPRQSTGLLLAQANQILLLKGQFRKDVHYGAPYPGSKKDTLLKPGAELLARRFGLRPQYESLAANIHIDTDHIEKSFIIYQYRCHMVDIASGAIVGEAIGSCTSLEEKYRYRKAERICPKCGKSAIMKSKAEYGGGWYCNKGKEGCGTKFVDTDPEIINQETGKILNANPFDVMNTVDKMAQKRAFVSAVLVATGASSYFAPGDDEVKDLYEVPADDINVVDTNFVVVSDDGQSFPVEEPRKQSTTTTAEGEPRKPWATVETLDALLKAINAKKGDDLNLAQLAALAGITDALNLGEWNTTFASGKAAGNAIAGAYDDVLANLPPAQPKGLTEAPTPVDAPVTSKGDLIENRVKQDEAAKQALNNGVPQTAKFDPSKAHKILTATKARRVVSGNSSYLELQTEFGPVRQYGVTEAFAKIEGEIARSILDPLLVKLKETPKIVDLGCMLTFEWELSKSGAYATVKEGTLALDIPF